MAEFNAAWDAQPVLRLVEPTPPRVDFTAALEREDNQVVIVPSDDDVSQLARALPDLAAVAWNDGGQRVNLSPLTHRAGRSLFVWLEDGAVTDWIARQCQAVGYAVKLIDYPGRVALTGLLARPGAEIQTWVGSHLTDWRAPEDVPDIIPDGEPEPNGPPDTPAEAPSGPAKPPAGHRTSKPTSKQLEALERAAADHILPGEQSTINDWMALGLHISQGKPTANISNISLLLDHIRPGEIWYDEFRQEILTLGSDGTTPRRWTDADDIRLTIEMQRRHGIHKATKGIVADAVIEFAMRNLRDELRDYIMGLRWDGVPRVEEAFVTLFGAKDNTYTREVAVNWFKSLCARAVWPGCKVDTMPVFEGEQGIGKSTVLEKLGGPYYSIMKEAPDTKDFMIALRGKHLIEIAEMDAFSRSDVKSTKRTMSTSTDRYRPPYGRHEVEQPRRGVFAGTCNTGDWNTDPTGARRFWPVACRTARPELAAQWRDQYFAEAFQLLMSGDKLDWWEFSDLAAVKREQDARYVEDDWIEAIKFTLRGHDSVTPAAIYQALDIDLPDRTKATQMRVGAVMRRLGWKTCAIWQSDIRESVRKWVKIGSAADPESEVAEQVKSAAPAPDQIDDEPAEF